MAFIDLGAPVTYAVSGLGSEELAKDIGGVNAGSSASEYEEWLKITRAAQIAPECGARALPQLVEGLQGGDDFGQLTASYQGSGSI